jgi:hypothetical protein
LVNRIFTLLVYHVALEGILTMMAMLMFAAAANAPVMLAARDEAQWRTFVRASLERSAPPAGARMRQLQGTVRALGDDRRGLQVAGPSGL